MSFLDYEKCKPEEYFLALKDAQAGVAVVIEDLYLRKKKEKTCEWIIQCAMLNMQTNRADFMRAYNFWVKNLGKKTP